MNEGRGVGWEVAFLVAALALGALGFIAAAALVMAVGLAPDVPGTAGPVNQIALGPVRLRLGLAAAGLFLVLAWVVRPRDRLE